MFFLSFSILIDCYLKLWMIQMNEASPWIFQFHVELNDTAYSLTIIINVMASKNTTSTANLLHRQQAKSAIYLCRASFTLGKPITSSASCVASRKLIILCQLCVTSIGIFIYIKHKSVVKIIMPSFVLKDYTFLNCSCL